MSTSKRARAVADLSQGTILATVEISAPPERVFQALSSSEITEWWGSPELYRVNDWTADLRPGGSWRASGLGVDGKPFSVGGELIEIDPPRKLVQTWKPDWDAGPPTRVTYLLDPIAGGTRLTLWHEGFAGRRESCAGHGDGWERVLGWLDGHFTASGQYFLCRLIPPRPSFALDMNAEERAVMGAHAAYWRDLLQKGVAVVFGPVADPAGAWGLGVLRGANEAEIVRLRDGDPAIQSARGFRYEILQMLTAVH